MKCKIVFTFLFSATGQYSSNFDLNISAQIRTRSSEEREKTEQEILAFEAAHQHRIETECDEGCPTRNDSGLSNDQGDSLQLTQEGDENLSSDSDDQRLVIDERDEDEAEAEEDEEN